MPAFSPALPVAAYIDQQWFDKEKALLFGRLWQFFTLESLVGTHNTFVAKKVSGFPVVVQNFNGEIKAFENICLHRHAPLQTEPNGCRPLTCPYHAWNYGADGKVAGIPFEKEYYQFSKEQRDSLRLREFALAKIGGLIFINLSTRPIPIEKQFSREFLDSLADASAQFDDEIVTAHYRRKFNWKLIFENLRDGLHPSFLHRNTLYKNVKFKPAEPSIKIIEEYIKERQQKAFDPLDEVRKWFSKGGADAPLPTPAQFPQQENIQRYGADDFYYNWLAFPNLHIASADGGYTFIIENYLPQGPAATDVEVYYVTAKRKDASKSSKDTLQEYLRGADTVLAEDFELVELIQDGLHADAPAPNWGAFELRNHRIDSWIARVVGEHITL